METMRPERSIGRALSFFTAELRAAGIETPRLDAELLLGHVIDKDRTRLAIDRDQELSDRQRLDAVALVARRIQGESVAYLVGNREFMGRDFAVGPGVLVPRPETELMVELAVSTIDRMWPGIPIRVVDICTGSGAVALSLARLTRSDLVSVAASDVSAAALAYARQNRTLLGLDQRVDLVEGDLLAWSNGPWDMILANPPYLTSEQIDKNPDLAAEPRLALDGGFDGLELIERMLDQSVPRVAPRFAMIIEIDPEQADAASALASARFPTADVIIVPDLTGRARFVSIERQEGPA